jgi:hypothetical protein
LERAADGIQGHKVGFDTAGIAIDLEQAAATDGLDAF